MERQRWIIVITMLTVFCVVNLLPSVVHNQVLSTSYIMKTISVKSHGDGYSAALADLSTPTGLVVTSGGLTIVVDRGNGKLRLINDATGVISTIDANLRNPTGISLNSKSGYVYYSDSGHHVIKKLDLNDMSISIIAGQMGKSGNTLGLASDALLNFPTGLHVNQDNEIFFSDSGNYQLKKITQNGQVILVAGTGTLGYSEDGTNATNAKLLMTPTIGGNTISQHPLSKELYFIDNFFIRKLVNGSIYTVGGGKSVGPGSFVFNSNGEIVMTQFVGQKLSTMNTLGNITDLAGTGSLFGDSTTDTLLSNETTFNFPAGLFIKETGEVLISDSRNNMIRKFSGAQVSSFAGSGTPSYFGNGIAVQDATFSSRIQMFYHAKTGDIYIADQYNHRVRKLSNGIVTNIAGNGKSGDTTGPALTSMLNSPQGVFVNDLGEVFIADSGNHKIKKVNSTGYMSVFVGSNKFSFENLGDNGPATSAILRDPCCVYGNSKGDIVIGDTSNYRIRKVASGNISTISGAGNSYNDVSIASQASLLSISSLYINSNDDIIFTETYKIRKIDSNGNMVLLAGNGKSGVSSDGSVASTNPVLYPKSAVQLPTGEVLFIEQNALRIITKDGILATIAGNVNECGLSGDNSMSNSSLLCLPTSVTINKEGNIFIYQNNYLRKLVPPTCFGIDSRDAKVCNGGGICQFTDTCSCFEGFSGSACVAVAQSSNVRLSLSTSVLDSFQVAWLVIISIVVSLQYHFM